MPPRPSFTFATVSSPPLPASEWSIIRFMSRTDFTIFGSMPGRHTTSRTSASNPAPTVTSPADTRALSSAWRSHSSARSS